MPRLPSSLIHSVRHAIIVTASFSLLFLLFFSPVILRGKLLAPGGGRLGDALLYHVAFFQSAKVLWDNLLGSGFPMMADPQVMSWYPPSLLLSMIPDSWNLFVVTAYVLASCFTYGYVYAVTKSKFASFVSGAVYGMCGFMIAHLGHTTIIHVAAWPPLIIWCLEILRQKYSRRWFALACVAIACCVLAGHLQIVAYALLLAATYAIVFGWTAGIGRARFYGIAGLVLVIGFGLAAVQLWPAAELANLSSRSSFGFADYVTYSLPPRQLVGFLYPAVFGGLRRYGTTQYFGAWNLTETSGYIGILPLLLAVIGVSSSVRRRFAIFWLCVAVVALLLALGDKTPVASVAYQLPALGKFRAPARHLMESSLAISVLAGLGAHAISQSKLTMRKLAYCVGAVAIAMIAGLAFLISMNHTVLAIPEGGTAQLNAMPWSNPAVAVPLILFLFAALSIFYWRSNPQSVFRKGLVLVILIIDLGSFGWFFSWHDYSPNKSVLQAPPSAARYAAQLRESGQRLVAIRGTLGVADEFPPNLARLWQIPTANNYSPLTLSRISDLLSLRTDASLDPSWKNANNQSLNLAAVRYLTLPRAKPIQSAQPIAWESEDMNYWLGGGCNLPQNKSIRFDFHSPIAATRLAIVSRLACSVGIPDATEVVRVSADDGFGNSETLSMRAGRDTAEWAYDCPTVKPFMRHQRAPIFSSFSTEMSGQGCEGHFYVMMLDFAQLKSVKHLEFSWTGNAEALSIEKLTLVNGDGRSLPVNPLAAYADRWRLVGESADATVYENLRALPRAWLVGETVTMNAGAILTAIKTSKLPDGRAFDPLHTVLLEEPSELAVQPQTGTPSARVTEITESSMEIAASSDRASFLVTSDTYYPAWRASIDGQPAKLFLANYAFRGVQVPAGSHRVRFEFRPKRFYTGAGITGLSIVFLTGLFFVRPFWRPRNQFG